MIMSADSVVHRRNSSCRLFLRLELVPIYILYTKQLCTFLFRIFFSCGRRNLVSNAVCISGIGLFVFLVTSLSDFHSCVRSFRPIPLLL